VISTVKYFAKEIIVFSETPEDAPASPELIRRARLWEKWTIIRNVLQLLGLVFLILAVVSK